MRMEDPEVVAAIVAGDPAGLAEAYDRYATPLYSYCRALLHEPADAADAVQDTFLVATAKLRDLRDPARLRPWLYAVARNECFRRLRAGKALSALDEAADIPATSADIGATAEQAELSQLIRAAMDGLNAGDRDVIELSLVQDLEGDELAAALGVSRNHAHALLSRARSQLERSLGALIVARTGRDACASLDSMLAGLDGRLTVLMRKRISRHIDDCDICGERKRRELTPAMFAGVVPIAALSLKALPAVLSPGFRDQLLRVLADRSPAGTAHRLSVANRAAPFGPNGFPKAASPPGAAPWRRVRHHPQAVVAVAAAAVVVAGAIAAGVMTGSQHRPPATAAGGPPHGASASAGTPGRGGPSGRHPGGGNGGNGNNGNGNNGSGGNGSGGNGGHGLVPTAPANGGTPTPVSLPSSGRPTPVTASGSPVPSATSTAPAPASSPPASTPAPAAGTLSLSTGTLRLVSVKGVATAKFTLTARGGPVSYSITPGSSLVGSLSVTPSSGSLASGASVTVTVTSTSLVALNGQLTVNPGGQTITVILSVSL
jgi:RNA polymerase sigma factor (sigma-70 family)